MIPHEIRTTALTVFLGLALFGVLYNLLISWAERHGYLAGLTSFSVALGNAVTVGVLVLSFWNISLPGWTWGFLLLAAFCCSGAPMVIGSRERHARETDRNTRARSGHRGMRWPYNMSALRDEAAVETLAAIRALSLVEPANDVQAARVFRAKASILKAASLLQQAGAPVDMRSV
jgi:hypothetical protein